MHFFFLNCHKHSSITVLLFRLQRKKGRNLFECYLFLLSSVFRCISVNVVTIFSILKTLSIFFLFFFHTLLLREWTEKKKEGRRGGGRGRKKRNISSLFFFVCKKKDELVFSFHQVDLTTVTKLTALETVLNDVLLYCLLSTKQKKNALLIKLEEERNFIWYVW